MTESHQRPSATSARRTPHRAKRSAFGATSGLPQWMAILLPLLLATAGAVLDHLLVHQPAGFLATVFVSIGCLLAVMLVQRRAVFGPTVQTPLVALIVLPSAVLLTARAPEDDLRQVVTLVLPLINTIPILTVTTAIALLIGLLRICFQPAHDDPAEKPSTVPDTEAQPEV